MVWDYICLIRLLDPIRYARQMLEPTSAEQRLRSELLDTWFNAVFGCYPPSTLHLPIHWLRLYSVPVSLTYLLPWSGLIHTHTRHYKNVEPHDVFLQEISWHHRPDSATSQFTYLTWIIPDTRLILVRIEDMVTIDGFGQLGHWVLDSVLSKISEL